MLVAAVQSPQFYTKMKFVGDAVSGWMRREQLLQPEDVLKRATRMEIPLKRVSFPGCLVLLMFAPPFNNVGSRLALWLGWIVRGLSRLVI